MKVLVFTTLFPNSKMPNHALFVKERIARLARLCDIRVVAPVPWHKSGRLPTEETIGGLKVYHPRYFITPKIFRLLYGLFMFISILGFVKKLKKEFDFDVIDAHFVYPDGFAAVLLGKLFGKKVIVNARGTDINWYPKFRIIRKLIQYSLRKADFVIAVSENLKEKIVGLGIAKEKIALIPNGVDADTFFPMSKTLARKELDIPESDKVLLYVGHLLESKGLDFLLEAMKLIDEKGLKLFVIGEGPYRAKIQDLARRSGLEARVQLLGEVAHKELYKWYSASDILCHTSLREGRPNVVLEALACGTPVISMNKWGLEDFVDQSRGVLLNSYAAQTIADAIKDGLKKDWDKATISSFMKQFSWDKTAKKVYEVFDAAIKKHDILFFSSDDWNSGLKTSKYHLTTRLARDNRVFFINSLGLRTPSPSARDVKRIFAKLAGFFRGVVEVRKNVFVYTPIAIPFQGSAIARFVNNIIITLQVKMIMKFCGVRNPLAWTFLPNSLGIVRKLKKKALIYYCVDDMSAFKGVPADIISKLDDELTREADMVFAVSKELFEKKRLLNRNTFYSPHGVDFELFNKAVTEKAVEKPMDIADIRKPIIGFYGLISADWIDYDLVRFVSKKRPDWSFVFVGKIDRLKDSPPEAKNIYYLPVKPYEELYKYSRFFDVAILPFNVNKLTMHSHPLKILEYLSAGKPVVSIKIPEVVKYESVIEIADGREDFLGKIEKCIMNDAREKIENRIKFASLNSWEKRFDEIQNTIACHS